MSVKLIEQMRTKLATLLGQVAAYQSAIAIAEEESRVQSDGTFKGAFEARVKKKKNGTWGGPHGKGVKAAKVVKAKNEWPDGRTRGAVKAFVTEHVNLQARPVDEAARLMPLMQQAGITTTKGSVAVAISKMRLEAAQAANGGAASVDLSGPVLAHLTEYGPMPFPTLRDWFEDQYPDVVLTQPRKAIGLLSTLKGEGKVSLTNEGWWQAV